MKPIQNLNKEINLLNELNDPTKFRFDEMNAYGFISKLSKIETDPGKIWEALTSIYGEGYFSKVIEQEY